MNRTVYRTAVLAVTWLASSAGHETGDYLAQLHGDAQRKQQRSPAGRMALARHVLTYSLAQAATKVAAYRAAGMRVSRRALVCGQVVEAILHAVIDDGRLLRRFADASGKREFHDLAAGGVNGRMLMDQACHQGLQVPAGAIVTALVARGGGSR